MTRDQLLRVAREAFAELGYAGASMGDIAARAGIRKSSLFHHFPTKDELYRDALAEVVEAIGGRVLEALGGDGDFVERLDRLSTALQRFLGENRVAARLLLREFIDGTAAVEAQGSAVEGVLRAAVEFLDAGVASGALPAQDTRHTALTLIGVHFTFFATPAVAGRLLGVDVFEAPTVDARTLEVRAQVRRLLGVR